MNWRNLEFIEHQLKRSRLIEESTILKSDTSDATDSFKTYKDVIKNIEFSVSDMPNKKTLQVFRYLEDGVFVGFLETFTFEFDDDYELVSGDEDMLEEFVSEIRMSSTKVQESVQDLETVIELLKTSFEKTYNYLDANGTIEFAVPKYNDEIVKIIITEIDEQITVVGVTLNDGFEDAVLNKTFEFQDGKIQNRSPRDAEQFVNLLEGLV